MHKSLIKFCMSYDFSNWVDENTYNQLDLSQGPVELTKDSYHVGGYLEHRPNQYFGSKYVKGVYKRDIHLGVDIIAPVGSKLYAGARLRKIDQDYRSAKSDYGYCSLFQFNWQGPELFLLIGHQSKASLGWVSIGQDIAKGVQIAQVGGTHENGDWFPHLHFQLSYRRPFICDMPGVCGSRELKGCKSIYPDPFYVLAKSFDTVLKQQE